MTTTPGSLSPRGLDAALELLGQSTLPVRGVSMRPTLVEGQLLEFEFGVGDPDRGDLLLFRQGGKLIVHRLLGRTRLADGTPALRTGGDGYLALDPPLARDHVLGRVIAVRQDGQWRSMRGRRARCYAWCLAWHNLLWAGAGIVASGVEGLPVLTRLGFPLRNWVTRLERRLLNAVHRLVFHRLHPPTRGPIDASGHAGAV